MFPLLLSVGLRHNTTDMRPMKTDLSESENLPEDVNESVGNTPYVLAGAGGLARLHCGVDLRLELHDSPPGGALPLRLLGKSRFLPQIIHEASLDLPDPALVLRLTGCLQVDEEKRAEHPERRVQEQEDQHLFAGNDFSVTCHPLQED